MSQEQSPPVRFEGAQPILRVQSMERSLRFYVGLLGFRSEPRPDLPIADQQS